MPVQLPPLSRRRFLQNVLTATAAVAVGRHWLAQAAETDAHTLALFSDTHVAADAAVVSRGINMADHLRAAAAEVLAESSRPAAVIVNGDCAQTLGLAADYATFGDLLKPVREAGLPVYLTLGNHDDRTEFKKAFTNSLPAEQPVMDRCVTVVPQPHANWFILDTMEFTNKTPGLLGEAQLHWLAEALDARRDKPAIVMLHHNIVVGETKSGLKDSAPLLEVLRPRTYVKAVFYGHTHVWSVTKEDSGIHFVNLPPVAYVFKEGLPSGWVRARVQTDSMEIELHTLDPKHPANREQHTLKWRTA